MVATVGETNWIIKVLKHLFKYYEWLSLSQIRDRLFTLKRLEKGGSLVFLSKFNK